MYDGAGVNGRNKFKCFFAYVSVVIGKRWDFLFNSTVLEKTGFLLNSVVFQKNSGGNILPFTVLHHHIDDTRGSVYFLLTTIISMRQTW